MAHDKPNPELIINQPRKCKLAAHVTSEENASSDKDEMAKRLHLAGIGSFYRQSPSIEDIEDDEARDWQG